jgi:hypothetical protein
MVVYDPLDWCRRYALLNPWIDRAIEGRMLLGYLSPDLVDREEVAALVV